MVPGPEMPGPLWISAARTLTRLGELAERAGVTFCLENLNTAVDHPGVPFARAADTLALVEAVGPVPGRLHPAAAVSRQTPPSGQPRLAGR